MSEPHDGSREINAAKHHLESAKKSSNFAAKVASSASERLTAATGQLKADETHLEDVRAQLKAAEAHLKAVKSQLAFAESRVQSSRSQMEAAKTDTDAAKSQAAVCEKEVADAQSRLNDVEKRWEVIDIENHVDLSKSSDEESSAAPNDDEFNDDANEETVANATESSKETDDEDDGPFTVTEYRVVGCKNNMINGIYKIQGEYPNWRRCNGNFVYSKVGVFEGKQENIVLCRSTLNRAGNCNWLIGIDSPEPVEQLYCSSKFRPVFRPVLGNVPPLSEWKKCINGKPSRKEVDLIVEPISGLERGEEVSFVDCITRGEFENIKVIIEGCGQQFLNGIYKFSLLCDDVPEYVKHHPNEDSYRISPMKLDHINGVIRWSIYFKDPRGNKREDLWMSYMVFSRSNTFIAPPRAEDWTPVGNWRGNETPPDVYALKTKHLSNSNNKKRHRQG